jgi:K+-transporting ATPase A subunit
MLLFVVLAVFVAGLMVGRTPEYVGKKIEAKEVKMAMLAILILPLMYLGWTAARSAATGGGLDGQSRSARLHRECSMPIRRRPATTARPSPG